MMQTIRKLVCSKRDFKTVQSILQRNELKIFRQASSYMPGTFTEAWQLQKYGAIEELQLNEVSVPVISKPDQVIVEVHAASLNPLDVAMLGGYGATALNILRLTEKCSKEPELPLTLGRDFAGTVVAKGAAVKNLSIGEEVWGVVSPHMQGSHARHICATASCVMKKPEKLSMVEAAALVYAAMTAWSALQITGGLAVLGSSGRKVLVLGAAGGVGSIAVQLLKAWGAKVVATCRSDAVPLLHALGLTSVVDYTQPDFHTKLRELGKYDIIFDCASLGTDGGKEYLQHLSDNPLSKYITLKSPLLREMDSKGPLAGALCSVANLVQANFRPGLLPRFVPVRWGFFAPLPAALKDLTSLAEAGKIVPCLDSVVDFKKAPSAFTKLQAGHVRGKIVLNMIDNTQKEAKES